MTKIAARIGTVVCLSALCGCSQIQRAEVTLCYDLKPPQHLPAGMASVAVARIDTSITGPSVTPQDEVAWQRRIREQIQQRLSEAVRASCYLYTTTEEIDRLIDGLRELAG